MTIQIIHFALTALPLLLAQTSLDGPVNNFFEFLKIILNLIAVVMVVWSGIKFHDGQVREGTYALLGAFVVLVARIIVHSIAGTAI